MIKLIKLVNGDDLIADIEKKEGFLILKKPYRLVFSNQGLASIPLCPFSSQENYEISDAHVLFQAEPEDEIKNSYREQIGSIVVPSSNIITQ
jgi:hypothetical protein